MLDLATLSRLQFAFTISFHILFPAFSIGLAMFILIMETLWLKTGKILYQDICKFWTKVFALTFGMGVVSGIVMEFQLGTNFAGFAHSVGGVLGGLFTYEVMTAFFIEAGFLGVMLFGWNKVGAKLHYFATFLVVLGTTISAYWILCANTWMQHPVGYKEVDGILEAASWKAIIFNSFIFPRFIHMLLAAYISAGFAISSICAYYLLKKRHLEFAKTCFSMIWLTLPAIVFLQIAIGDLNGEKVLEYQPLKTAAMEGIWDSGQGIPFLPFAWPDQQDQKNEYAIQIPHIASLINTHQWNGAMIGLKSVAPDLQPNVLWVFFSFRIMVGLGFIMAGLALYAVYLRLRGKLITSPFFLKMCVLASPCGFIALWCGWITAETGRQPWIVYNLLKTKDAVSNVTYSHVLTGFILIILVYFIIFGCFYFYYLNKLLQKGPASKQLETQPFSYMHDANQEVGR